GATAAAATKLRTSVSLFMQAVKRMASRVLIPQLLFRRDGRLSLQRIYQRLQPSARVALILQIAAEETGDLLEGGDDLRRCVGRRYRTGRLFSPFDRCRLLRCPSLHLARPRGERFVDGSFQQ